MVFTSQGHITHDNKIHVSAERAAKESNLSAAHLRHMARNSRIPAIKFAGAWYFNLADTRQALLKENNYRA